jgi:chromosome segregation ATPase
MLGRIRHVIRHCVVVHTDVRARDRTQARVLVQSAVSHVARDFRRHTTAESTAKTSCLDHSFNKLVAQAEQDGTSSITNFTSETHIWTPEHHDIVDKILATKILIAQYKKITGEIASLESQQALARSQYSNLDGAAKEQEVARANLLTEAQTWREQADEAERQASCHQRNAGKLKEEAENQRAVLEESTFRLNTAREESVRLAKGVRNTMEEALGGDLVELLSLHTHDAS